ncbi:hypothetical protein CEUSTIGMA_g242.t1 [Chlamydomonas eustigma]|uniref:Vps41 beta-propeller domain-containing protein n=1 Tax=Chlamydomonas eustigma TaxID=1157962 RepID=A0A250WQ12_9CHLO|nr:hypothetical protein CEUSTIGMA_g242.t1 [Chlamydomonas eustigma]|eukprot:GAX72786.1 hypothetical protein CEUSTIGMA_g242.t1 [Chlamydomonas eustigma]
MVNEIHDHEVREPNLKYESLGGDVNSITNDEVSSLCLSDKILAIGTSKGNVHVLDYSGNEIRRLELHSGRVNDISFDKDEEHIATCSQDCSVVVINLYTDVRQRQVYKKPVKTLAIDPRYASRKTKEYVSAGDVGMVQLSTQGWLGRSEYPLYEGKVQLVRWSDSLVAWGSSKAVTVYDTNTHSQLRTITRYPPLSRNKVIPAVTSQSNSSSSTAAAAAAAAASSAAQAAAAPEGHVAIWFGNGSKLYISWPDCIKVARVIAMENNIGSLTHQLEVVMEMYTDYFVLGVSPFGEDLAVLTYPVGARGEETAASTEPGTSAAPEPETSSVAGPSTDGLPAPVSKEAVFNRGTNSASAAAVAATGGSRPAGQRWVVLPGRKPKLRIVSVTNKVLAEDELPVEGWERRSHLDYFLVPSLPVMSAKTNQSLPKTKDLNSNSASVHSPPASVPKSMSSSTVSTATSSHQDTPVHSHFKEADVESMYFIVSPKSILVSRTRDTNDHVLWLLEHHRYEEALITAETERSVPADTYEKVVQAYMDDLLQREAYEAAAQLSPRLLKQNEGMWEKWVYLFAQTRQLPKLAPHIPTENPRLRDVVYEMVLRSLLVAPEDHPTLLELVRAWPQGLFSMPTLVDAVAARMKRPGGDDPTLWRLLALLYQRQGRPDLSLSILLQLKSPDAFSFIEQHALVGDLVGGRAAVLLDIDESAALRMLTRNVEALPPAVVVPSLQECLDEALGRGADEEAGVWRSRLYRYLAGVMELDASAASDYHELQVQLTADYAPSKLMEFLTASQYYPLEAALAICQRRNMVSEQVYILGRMGISRQALHLIIEKLGDIPQAIDFVRCQRDEELWDYLITWALGSSETTGALMDHAGGYINPLTLIKRLPKGLTVPRLRDRLRTIIGDFRTQTSLHEGCNGILRSDCMHLMHRLYFEARHSIRLCYVEWKDRMSGHVTWKRYDSITGALEMISLHSMPSAIMTALDAAGRTSSPTFSQLSQGKLLSPASTSPGDSSHSIGKFINVPWIGFNVEDAAAHIKLDSKDGSVSEGGAATEYNAQHKRNMKGRSQVTNNGAQKRRQQAASAVSNYDPAAWAPQSGTGLSAPSLVRRL